MLSYSFLASSTTLRRCLLSKSGVVQSDICCSCSRYNNDVIKKTAWTRITKQKLHNVAYNKVNAVQQQAYRHVNWQYPKNCYYLNPILQRFSISIKRPFISTSNSNQNAMRNMSTKNNKADENSAVSSMDSIPTAATYSGSSSITKRLEIATDKVRAKMHWNLSDFFSVVSAFLLLTGILFGPYVVEKMKKSKNSYEELVLDDEFTNLVHVLKEYHNEVLHNEEAASSDTNSSNPMISLVLDICKQVINNPDVQQSAQSMILQIIQSPLVQEALQDLSKDTCVKLLQDEQLKQYLVQLLQGVISEKAFQASASNLVVSLFREETFQKELVNLIVRLSENDKVLDATKLLLTESAHKTLVDPEILEHSMEFAADVVGDDFVQRTSGEALWNTISYSVQPAFFSMLYFAGAVLVGFTFVALSKAQFYSNVAAVAGALDFPIVTTGWWSWASWELLGQELRSKTTHIFSLLVIQPCSVLASSAKSVLQNFFGMLWTSGYNAGSYLKQKNTNVLVSGAKFCVQISKQALVGASLATSRMAVALSTGFRRGFFKLLSSCGSYVYRGAKVVAFDFPILLYHKITARFFW